MPRLSASELQAARQRRGRERAEEGVKKAEADKLKAEHAAGRRATLQEKRERHHQLVSVVGAIYDEVDKPNRKWPTQPVSELMLERANKAIRAVRTLMSDEEDEFLDDIVEMVPAGDMPANRDVSLTLREVQAALQRLERKYRSEWI
jgi:hypothetical protein